ncbi:MAG: hypothetical protein DYH12_33075, partial [Sorangiineae bacterium PRO1]|nr:hypothetical protein [Sorangiineae bacterium PRO1]
MSARTSLVVGVVLGSTLGLPLACSGATSDDASGGGGGVPQQGGSGGGKVDDGGLWPDGAGG